MTTPPPPTPREAARVWWRIGLLSFGGPAAQIALMHREIVELRGWLSERQFLNALSFCMLLPGPEAMQLATYAGWRLHGVRGGVTAGLAFAGGGGPPGGGDLNPVFAHLTQLQLAGSFTGNDVFRIGLEASNFANRGFANPDALNTNMALLGFQSNTR